MFALYPNLCYNEVFDKWTALNFAKDLIYFLFPSFAATTNGLY